MSEEEIRWDRSRVDNTDDNDDDVIVIPPRKNIRFKPKKIKCGACGFTYRSGDVLYVSCNKNECPIFNNTATFQAAV